MARQPDDEALSRCLGQPVPWRAFRDALDTYLKAVEAKGSDMRSDPLDEIYGTGAAATGRTKRPAQLLQSATEALEGIAEEVYAIRSPARVNLRGMHIDNNGGYCNSVCVDKDTVMVFGVRKLDPNQDPMCVLSLQNKDERFTPSSIEVFSRDDYTEDQAKAIGWVKYPTATVAVLERKLQELLGKDRRHVWSYGIDGSLASDVPAASGLSSSHALTLCLIGALCAANGVQLEEIDELLLAQKVEHTVGVKSGLMDHGSMIYGQRDKVLHARFYDLKVPEIPSTVSHTAWPEDAAIVVANSGLSRKLAMVGSAIEYSLPRLGCSIAFPIMREQAAKLGYPPDEAQWDLDMVLDLLRSVPTAATQHELLETFPDYKSVVLKAIDRFIPGGCNALGDTQVPLRGSTLFVLAECARAREFFNALERKDLATCGRLMKVGHLGDDPDGDLRIDEEALEKWRGTEGGLAFVPGVFKAGHEKLDELCRILEANGALGSSLTGAGMGGCVIGIFPSRTTGEAAVKALLAAMKHMGPEEAFVATPVAGRGLLDLSGFLSI